MCVLNGLGRAGGTDLLLNLETLDVHLCEKFILSLLSVAQGISLLVCVNTNTR